MIVRRSPARRRGEPIVALVLLLGGWVGVRAAILDDAGGASLARAPTGGERQSPAAAPAPRDPGASPAWSAPLPLPQSVPVRDSAVAAEAQDAPNSAATPGNPDEARAALRLGGGHQLLWMAGLSMLPLPVDAEAALAQPVAPLRPLPPRGHGAQHNPGPAPLRWSADGWIVWRQGGNGFNLPGAGLPGASVPSGAYGASQAGVVLRYRLAPSNPLRPTLYLRGSSALQAPRGEEVAAGFALRPLAGVPVAAMGELRATRSVGGKVVVRPAAALVSELPVQPLPFGLRAEAYVQAGYVGGQDATPFVDGQARIERPLVRLGPAELRAGGGVWGGAQNGAQRLDIGPTATLAVPVGPGGSRVSADWRFRVAGDAAPGSGPAITLSAGF